MPFGSGWGVETHATWPATFRTLTLSVPRNPLALWTPLFFIAFLTISLKIFEAVIRHVNIYDCYVLLMNRPLLSRRLDFLAIFLL